jgi:hypothetical protein
MVHVIIAIDLTGVAYLAGVECSFLRRLGLHGPGARRSIRGTVRYAAVCAGAPDRKCINNPGLGV